MRLSRANLLFTGVLALGLSTAAWAGGYFTNGLPFQTTMTGLESFGFDTNKPGGASPQVAAITSTNLAGYVKSLAVVDNGLIGGDFGTNLWQRGTTGPSTTTALLYNADRWWGLSGTGTAFTVIKETGASDITSGFNASARVARTASQTGILPICQGQALTTGNSVPMQGKKVEFSFWAKYGANFSAALKQVTATIAYGTGANESAANFSTGAWTGYTVSVAQAKTLTTSWARYSVVATLPVTETQVGVKICYTPVGTAGADDWFEFTGAQIDANAAALADSNFAAFAFRQSSEEAELQYRYFYRLAEPASGAAISGTCQAVGASTNICNVNMPVIMRATVPTITITTAGTFKVNIAGTPTTIATPTASTCSVSSCAVTAANTNTAGQAELLSGGGGTGAWDISAEL